MTPKPKTDGDETMTKKSGEEIVSLVRGVLFTTSKEYIDDEAMQSIAILSYSTAESELLPIIERLEQRLDKLRDGFFKEQHEIENILGKATGNVITQEIKDAIGGELGEGFFGGAIPIEIAHIVAKHIEQKDERIRELEAIIERAKVVVPLQYLYVFAEAKKGGE